MQIEKILEAVCGLDEHGKGKALCKVNTYLVDLKDETKQPTPIDNAVSLDMVVTCTFDYDCMQFDLDCGKNSEILKKFNAVAENYRILKKENTEEKAVAFCMYFIPLSMEGKYFIQAVDLKCNGIASNEYFNDFTKIRFEFLKDDVVFGETDMDTETFTESIESLKDVHTPDYSQPSTDYSEDEDDDLDYSEKELKYAEVDDDYSD